MNIAITPLERRLAAAGWVRVGFFKKEEESSPLNGNLANFLKECTKNHIPKLTERDPDLQAEGLQPIVSVYVPPFYEERVRHITKKYCLKVL